ncbi:hypothetical protein ACTD5D_33200 [Nocardia takedensis]|uniref:hypothetical protein n=1 Tax=Nocardia takedensis TaxID=259390 RepID=UPI003F775E61
MSPLQLIYPDLAHGQVDVLPGVTTTSAEAMRWFSGESTLGDDPAILDRAATRAMNWTRTLYRLAFQLRGSMNFAYSLSGTTDFDQAATRVEENRHQLEQWVEMMEDAGFPASGDDIGHLLAASGADRMSAFIAAVSREDGSDAQG